MTGFRRNWRLYLAACALVLGLTGLGTRLAFLHLSSNDRYHDRVKKLRHMEKDLVVGRGRVLDRNGRPLAMDLTVKNICADPLVINEKGYAKLIGQTLSRTLNVDPAYLEERLGRKERRFEYVKKYVHEEESTRVKDMQFPGIFFQDTSKRYYPHNELMCHVVGFSNMNGDGSGGIEQWLDSYLRGMPGLRVSEYDGRHREIYARRTLDIEPQQGADVYLTLDTTIQHMLEVSLHAAMVTNHAKGAWAIVQQVRTGEILAMASYPAYDLNAFGRSTQEERRNRAISYVYEPGSTFKVAVIAAALNEKVVAPDDVIDCENGYWVYGKRPLRDSHSYDHLSVADVLKKSSNIGAAKIALKLGDERLERYLREFGVGRRTGVELPGEEGGILHPHRKWTPLSITRIAMGHEVAVTALQMLGMISAIANDGFLMRPAVLSRVVDVQGRTIYSAEPEVLSRPISEETAETMCELLVHVTEPGGTGTRAAIPGLRVAGKTGTAQKAVKGGYSSSAHIASFAGFFPADKPQIAMIVVVDEPQPVHYGGTVSAPVFAQVGEELSRYLSTRPDMWPGSGQLAVTSVGRVDGLSE